jgi:hypothetical protein
VFLICPEISEVGQTKMVHVRYVKRVLQLLELFSLSFSIPHINQSHAQTCILNSHVHGSACILFPFLRLILQMFQMYAPTLLALKCTDMC